MHKINIVSYLGSDKFGKEMGPHNHFIPLESILTSGWNSVSDILGYYDAVPSWVYTTFHYSILDRLSAAEISREVSHLLSSCCRQLGDPTGAGQKALHGRMAHKTRRIIECWQ